MSGRLLGGPFVALQAPLVRSLGSIEAALILEFIAFRQPEDGSPVAVPVREVCEATGMADSTVKRHTRALADKGVLVKHQSGRNAVVEYEVVRDHPLIRGAGAAPEPVADPVPDRPARGAPAATQGATAAPCLLIEEEEELRTPPSESAEAPPSSRTCDTQPAEPGLFAAPEPEPVWPPEATVNGVRQAWLAAYTGRWGTPDPSLKRRAFGTIKGLARDRSDLDSWRALWTAAAQAGEAGRWNVATFIGPRPDPLFKQRVDNPYIAHAVGAANAGLLSTMDAMLGFDRPALGGTA